MKRVLLLSTVHLATDSRVMYKIAPSLQSRYRVLCALPGLRSSAAGSIVTFGMPHFRHLLLRLLISHPVAWLQCVRARPDLVHIFVPELIPMALALQWMGVKVIYEVQENLYKKFAIKRYNKHFIFKKLFVLFDRIARRRFHCIFTDDAYLQEYRNLGKPFAIVHNYVSLPLIDHFAGVRTLQAAPEFFYLGVVSMERCLDTMVRALTILKSQLPAFHLHLFGPVRASQKEIEAIPGYSSVKEHLTFHGYTDQRDALRYAASAVAGIALLRPVADYPESFPTKLFEYMALKLPVITSDFPIYREIIAGAQCGFCIPPDDAQALAARLAACIADPDMRIRLGENGRKAAESRFNWRLEEAVLLSFYEQVLHS